MQLQCLSVIVQTVRGLVSLVIINFILVLKCSWNHLNVVTLINRKKIPTTFKICYSFSFITLGVIVLQRQKILRVACSVRVMLVLVIDLVHKEIIVLLVLH